MLDDINLSANSSDLVLGVRLKQMSKQTQLKTIQSLKKLRRAVAGDSDLEVGTIRCIVAEPDLELRKSLEPRASQVFSDIRRALKIWDEPPIQSLVLKMRSTVMTCDHAIDAAHLNFPPERARRAEGAIRAFAKYLNQPVDAIIATETVIVPKLAALAPEDLAVGSIQSLKNKKTLIRSAIALIDPVCSPRMPVDMTRIGDVWRPTLDMLLSRAPLHSPSVAAIFRRFALTFDTEGKAPHCLKKTDLEVFVYRERQTHNPPFRAKLRLAMKIWNQTIDEGLLTAVRFDLSRRDERLPNVAWETVPPAIREPIDALLGKATESDRGGGVWEDLIRDDLGVPDAESNGNEGSSLTINPASAELWRRAVKRVWHAAANDEGGTGEPKTLYALYTVQNARSFVKAAWASRKKKFDKAGKDWETNKKGIYETGLLKTFVTAGRTLGIEEVHLEKIRVFIHKIDPAVLGKKKMPDGRIVIIYDELRIGPRHSDMLRAFNQDSVIARWFKAPEQLWSEALMGKSRKNGVNDKDAALARSGLILRILQRVSPLRRTNLARLRISGPQPHIHLPIGNGEGRLYLPAMEMKNLKAIEVRIDQDTARMIREFIKTFRPIAMSRQGISEQNDHLFPGAERKQPELGETAGYPEGFGYHTPDSFSSTYSRHMQRRCALDVDLHVARHIAAKVILDMDPSAMGLVQEILEHKSIETTRAYYAAVSKIIAQKRYLQLLDQATRRSLGEIDFTIGFENQLRG